ncbi:SDR family oxidoreductase [bacterium]|nr:SDR family oxidoreductase [bacterium]
MVTLIVGASGATGRLLVAQLLNCGEQVKLIVRAESNWSETLTNHKNLTIIHASVLELSDAEMTQLVNGCNSIASCLGHNISFKGMYGHPRKLVTDATSRLCKAIKANKPEMPVKFVLMNTAGNSNRDLSEHISFAQKCLIWLMRVLLPPLIDNEKAVDFLRTQIGQDDSEIEWAAVRPDNLKNESYVTEYEVYPSPIRSAIFDAGNTSRINVAHFMAELITNNEKWEKWKGQMPVIYNKLSEQS